MIDPNPCKDCTERYTACHDRCEKHKKWLAQFHAQQKQLNEQKNRWSTPRSAARDKRNAFNTKHPIKGIKGGDQ